MSLLTHRMKKIKAQKQQIQDKVCSMCGKEITYDTTFYMDNGILHNWQPLVPEKMPYSPICDGCVYEQRNKEMRNCA
jgi:hypothetical protein